MLPKDHKYNGAMGCVGYSLGQSVATMPFLNELKGRDATDNPLVHIKQCR